MEKSLVVHTRVTPLVKEKCEEIFDKLGITTSYAISLFLNQVSLRNGIPFSIELPNNSEKSNSDVDFAIGVSTVDSDEPTEKAKKLLNLLANNVIDLETYEFAIRRLYEKK